MENIGNNVALLLNGKDIDESQDLCDFTLMDQNDNADFVPMLGQSVCYVVMAVILNEKNEVLVMQEAKSSCVGKWYLPAGKVEPNESLMDAFKREVLEETGLTAEPTTLLLVESAAGFWYRFVFAGNMTGGSIKTLFQANSESLQAKWVQNLSELKLRVDDIISIVEHARNFKTQLYTPTFHPFLLPASRSYSKLYLRLLVCARRKINNRVQILISEKTEAHLPTCEIHPGRNFHEILENFMRNIFGVDFPSYQPHGVLALGHNYQQRPNIADGFCLTLLVSLRFPIEELVLLEKYSWFEVNLEVAGNIVSKMGKFSTVGMQSTKINTLLC